MPGSQLRPSSSHDAHSNPGLSSSPSRFLSSSPLAERYLAEDIAACSDTEDVETLDETRDHEHEGVPHLSYRRPSGVAYGGRPVLNPQAGDEAGLSILSPLERKQSRDAERSLLRDNHLLPPKHHHHRAEEPQPGNAFSRLYRRVFSPAQPTKQRGDEESPDVVVQPPDERAPLLGARAPDGTPGAGETVSSSSSVSDEELDEQWVQAVTEGRIRTTWQREAKTLTQYSAPLIATFLLQYSINVASIFAVGRIGKIELGAVSCKSQPCKITIPCPTPANAQHSGQYVRRHHLPSPFPRPCHLA